MALGVLTKLLYFSWHLDW